jgi:hypothetical protein
MLLRPSVFRVPVPCCFLVCLWLCFKHWQAAQRRNHGKWKWNEYIRLNWESLVTWKTFQINTSEYLDVIVLQRGVGEVRVVAERELQHADKCGGECSTRKNAFITALETSARTESKRMTNHNTPQLSRMDLANHCAAFPGLSLLNTRVVYWIKWQYFINISFRSRRNCSAVENSLEAKRKVW